MSLLVTGSIGIDTVKTPHGASEDCLGGSSVYFSMAASFLASVRFVGVVGADCPFNLNEVFHGRDVNLLGLEVRAKSKTFRWSGTYLDNMDDRVTNSCELNVLAEAPPQVPGTFRNSRFVFLANTAPALQMQLLEQLDRPLFTAADTMDLWINENRSDLLTLLKKIDCLIINEDEARLLADEPNLIKASLKILKMGVRLVLIKKGASGSLICSSDGEMFLLPAYPAAEVIDPTGAGDSFAGGFMGIIAKEQRTDFNTLKRAVAWGTIMASYTITDFSLKGLQNVTQADLAKRMARLERLTSF